MGTRKLKSESHSQRLLSMLSQLRAQHVLCDLTIEVSGGVEFTVHKVVLVSHSKYFKNQLDCGNLQGNRFYIPSVDAKMLTPLLHFLYTGELVISENNIWDIITAATQLDMTDAISLCETFLNNPVKPEQQEAGTVLTKSTTNDMDKRNTYNTYDQLKEQSHQEIHFTKKKRGRPRKRVASSDDNIADPLVSENEADSDGNESDWKPDHPTHVTSRKKRKQTNPRKVIPTRRGPGRPRGSIRNHRSKVIITPSTRRILVKRDKKFTCPQCQKRFSFQSTYALHTKRHRRGRCRGHQKVHDTEGIYRMFPFRYAKPEKDPEGYKCKVCPQTSKYMSMGENHRVRCHTKSKQCEDCPFSFTSAVGLFQHHIQRHRGLLHVSSSDLYRCRMCPVIYRHKNNFLNHIKTVHNSGTRCQSCSRNYKPTQMRHRHLIQCYRVTPPKPTRKQGGATNEMNCPHCNREFKYQKAYDKHRRMCTETSPLKHGHVLRASSYTCKNCGEELDSLQQLRAHNREMHPPLTINKKRRPYAKRCSKWDCDACSFTSTNPHQLMKHVKASHPDVHLPCSQAECRFTAGAQCLLDRHLRVRHVCSLACEICNRSFSVPAQLRVHRYVKHKINDGSVQVHHCPVDGCKYKCVWKSSMKIHMQRHRSGKPFTCSVCDKKFKREIGLTKHMNKIHKRIRPFMCDICGQAYGEEAELKAHITRHNTDKQYKCDQCPYASHDKGNFQSHMYGMHQIVMNPDMSIFTCNICDYSTDRKHRYDMHMKNHMGIRDITCPICSKSFVTKNTLSNHIQRVHSEKSYTCSYCQYTTGNQHTFKEHVRVMHTHRNIKPYKCAYCDFRCHTSGNCRKHCANRHKGLEIKWVRLCELYSGNAPQDGEGYLEERPMVESNIKHLAIARRISKDVVTQPQQQPQQQESHYQSGENRLMSTRPATLQKARHQHQQQQVAHNQSLQAAHSIAPQPLSLSPEPMNLAPGPQVSHSGGGGNLGNNPMVTSNHGANSFGVPPISYSGLSSSNPSLVSHITHPQAHQGALLHIPHVPMPVMQGRSNHDNVHVSNLHAGMMSYDYSQQGHLPSQQQPQQQQHHHHHHHPHKHLTLL